MRYGMLGAYELHQFTTGSGGHALAMYDGASVIVHPLPAGWSYLAGAGEAFNGKYYIPIFGNDNNNDLAEIDASGITVIASPTGFTNAWQGIQKIAAHYQSKLIISATNAANERRMLTFDGSTFTELDPGTPYHGAYKGFFGNVFELNGLLYAYISNSNGTFNVFSVDGSALTEFPSPAGPGMSVAKIYNGAAYMRVDNAIANGFSALYKFDGATYTQIPYPANITKLISDYNTFNGIPMLLGRANDNSYRLLQLDGNALAEVPLPASLMGTTYASLGSSSKSFNNTLVLQGHTSTGNKMVVTYDGTAVAV